jgi:hypothetical protein
MLPSRFLIAGVDAGTAGAGLPLSEEGKEQTEYLQL